MQKQRRRRLLTVLGIGYCSLVALRQLFLLVRSSSSNDDRRGKAGRKHQVAPLGRAKEIDKLMLQLGSIPVRNTSITTIARPGSYSLRPPLVHQNDQNRSTLIIHIGPPKVGTSYIQCSLCGPTSQANREKSLLSFLKRDSYVFLGTCPWRVCGLPDEPVWSTVLEHRFGSFMTRDFGLNRWTGPQLHSSVSSEINGINAPRVKKRLLRRLDRLRETGQNGILVFEGLSVSDPAWIAELAAYLQATDWISIVVVAYRPLYSWLPSKYNSLTKVGKNPSVVHWPNDPACQADDSGCQRIEPFTLSLPTGKNPRDDRFAAYLRYLEATRMHPSHMSYLNYAAHFPTLTILPLHRLESLGMGDPLLEHLFCASIPNAPETCRSIRTLEYDHHHGGSDGDATTPIARNSFDPSPNYDRLALHAFETMAYNHSRWNASRPQLRKWTRLFHERVLGGVQLPQLCWNRSDLDRLENLSWTVERRMVQNLSGRNADSAVSAPSLLVLDEALHRRGFARAVQDGQSYCWLDVNRTLDEDPRWRAFYDSPYDPENKA